MVRKSKGATATFPAFDPAKSLPISRQGLAEFVVTHILESVQVGLLRPGDRLPSERNLVEIFDVSRPILREALRALSTLGVVGTRHGGGAFITDLNAKSLLAPLDFFLSLSETNLHDVFESRRAIEGELAHKAAELASAEDIGKLDALIAAHADVGSDPVRFRILDSRLHELIYAMAGNVVLERIATGLYSMGQNIRRRATTDAALISQSTKDHARIVGAIKAGDPAKARAAMVKHIDHIEKSTVRTMEAMRRNMQHTRLAEADQGASGTKDTRFSKRTSAAKNAAT